VQIKIVKKEKKTKIENKILKRIELIFFYLLRIKVLREKIMRYK